MQTFHFQLKNKTDKTPWNEVPVFVSRHNEYESAAIFAKSILKYLDIDIRMDMPDNDKFLPKVLNK